MTSKRIEKDLPRNFVLHSRRSLGPTHRWTAIAWHRHAMLPVQTRRVWDCQTAETARGGGLGGLSGAAVLWQCHASCLRPWDIKRDSRHQSYRSRSIRLHGPFSTWPPWISPHRVPPWLDFRHVDFSTAKWPVLSRVVQATPTQY